MNLPKPTTLLAVCNKIKKQFPDTPEGRLWFTVLRNEIRGLSKPKKRADSIKYLNGEMTIYQLCNVDPDWIRRVLKEAKVI